MKKKTIIKAGTALAVVLALSSLNVFAAPETSRTAGSPTDTYKALNLFGDVFEQVRANYVESTDDKKLVEYALEGMLSNLDAHSSYMTEEEAKELVADAIRAGIFNDLGSGSNVDVCVITKDKTEMIRPYHVANLKGQKYFIID